MCTFTNKKAAKAPVFQRKENSNIEFLHMWQYQIYCVCVYHVATNATKDYIGVLKEKKKEIQLLFSIFILSTVRWSDMFYSVSGREVTNAVSEWMDGMTFLKGIQIP